MLRTRSRSLGTTRYAGVMTNAITLLGTESQGMSIDFADMSMLIRDTTTPANYFKGDPNNKLTYSAPSAKWILGSSGLWESGTTLRTSYDTSGNALGVLLEVARTNLCLRSNDLTNASWTKSNMTAALTATGPDGTANSATTITATAGNATVLQSITSASAARVTSVFLKRRTGTGNIDVTQNNGTAWATQTVTSSWTRFAVASATITDPVVGIRIVTNGDAVDVWCVSHEIGAHITSPIVTAGSTVTRNADDVLINATAFPFATATGTLFINWRFLSTAVSGEGMVGLIKVSDANNYRCQHRAAYSPLTVAGTSKEFFAYQTPAVVAEKRAVAYTANDNAGSRNGAAAQTDATVGGPTGYDRLAFSAGGGTFAPNGYVKQLMYLPRRMTNVEMQTLTT